MPALQIPDLDQKTMTLLGLGQRPTVARLRMKHEWCSSES